MTDVYLQDGVVKLSTGIYNGVGTAIGDGGMSLINIIIGFFPWMLVITLSIFAVRFLFGLAHMFLNGGKISIMGGDKKEWSIRDGSVYTTSRSENIYDVDKNGNKSLSKVVNISDQQNRSRNQEKIRHQSGLFG